jgi:hypothetical protein
MKLISKEAYGNIDTESVRLKVTVSVGKYEFTVDGQYNFVRNWFHPSEVDEIDASFYDDVQKLVERK